jgi:hypothetical protein
MPKPKKPQEKVEIEPGAEKRLANILRKALNTPPTHRASAPSKAAQKGPKETKS